MRIDAHIHLYPPSVYANPTEWGAKRGEAYWLNCVNPTSGPQLQGWASVDQLLKDMDTACIEKALILGWYWENADTCFENIGWQWEWIAQHPDRLKALAPFNAIGGARSIDSLKKAFDNGFIGIGEIYPPAQGFSYENDALDAALDLVAQEESMIVNVHVTDPTTRDYPGKIDTPIDDLSALAKRHPRTKFVFAHLAGMMNLPELKTLSNVYLDTAAVPLLYKEDIYQTAIDLIGSERILFGTDYPLRTFPKKQSAPDFATHVDSICNAGIDAKDLEQILYRNLNQILEPDA